MKKVVVVMTFWLCSCVSNVQKSNEGIVNSLLLESKKNSAQVINTLYRFPKGADLHNHASGAEYIEHALIFSMENGYNYNIDRKAIFNPKNHSEIPVNEVDQNKCSYAYEGIRCAISVSELINRKNELNLYLNLVSNRGVGHTQDLPIDHFFNVFDYIKVPNRGVEYISNIIYRNYDQSIRYLELMTAVVDSNITEKVYSLLPRENFNAENYEQSYSYISGYLDSEEFKILINRAMDEQENRLNRLLLSKYDISISGDYPDVIVKYIPQLYRIQDPYYTFLDSAINMKASMVDKRIVATNMVHRESAITSQLYFDKQMEILDFFWRKYAHPNIALHAGELTLQESPVEPMRSRISQSIYTGKASRIGHGVSIGWERDMDNLLKYMRIHGIAVEICLSSNESVLGVDTKDHPLSLYLNANVPITLATDDEGVFRSNLTMEYVKAVQEHGLTYYQIKEISKNGLEYSFLTGESIYEKGGEIKRKYQPYKSGDLPSRYELGEKAYLQIRHERDLAQFEESVMISVKSR